MKDCCDASFAPGLDWSSLESSMSPRVGMLLRSLMLAHGQPDAGPGHDYGQMLAELEELYERQPVHFANDWRVVRFMSSTVSEISDATKSPVLTLPSFDGLAMDGLSGGVPRDFGGCRFTMGNPSFDLALPVVVFDFTNEEVATCLSSLITAGVQARHLMWFVCHHLLRLLVLAVSRCDEAAINRVQRRIAFFYSYAAGLGLFR